VTIERAISEISAEKNEIKKKRERKKEISDMMTSAKQNSPRRSVAGERP